MPCLAWVIVSKTEQNMQLVQLIKTGDMRHEKRELILPPQSHFAGTAGEGDGCDKFLAMWLQQRQTGRGRARKGQPTEPRTSFASPASPIFLGVVVAVGELRADAGKGFSGSEMVSDLMNQVSILNLHNM